MNKFLVVIGIIIVAAVGWFVLFRTGKNQAPSPTSQATPNVEEGKAPDFHLQDYNGKTISLADFAGKPIVINSWASWCPFCRQELPDFATVQKELGDKVIIIAIDRQESLATAKSYTDAQGTSNSLIFLLNPNDSFYKSIGGFSMPETIFVDKSGNIVDHKRGPMDVNEIRQRIKKIIQ